MSKDLENNKIIASVLLAGLIAMFSGFFTNLFYKPDFHHEKRGYEIDVSSLMTEQGSEKKEEIIDIKALLAVADINAGAKVANKCAACHSFDKGAPHKVGPNLYGLIGSQIAARAGFTYSDSLKEKDTIWNYDEFFAFMKAPKKYAPGTKMSFAGLRKPKDIANLVQYLRSKSDSSYPLP